ncbi:MAG: hypothetical protein AAGE99_00185 [Chlamydiota bacterium]
MTGLLKVGSATIMIDMSKRGREDLSFVGKGIDLYAWSNSKEGFCVMISADSKFVHGRNWKLLHLADEKWFLEWDLLCDHDCSGRCTPVETEGFCIRPEGGTRCHDRSEILVCHRKGGEYTYVVYPEILFTDVRAIPSGFYQGTLQVILINY